MKLYIAGPMRGRPQFNFPAFFEAQEFYEKLGHETYNPAAKDVERFGEEFYLDNPDGSIDLAHMNHGFSLRESVARDLAWISSEADGIIMLYEWRESKGAVAEMAVAEALGLEVYYFYPPGTIEKGEWRDV